MPVSVVTVDDQAVFRDTAHDVIDATPGFEAVGEAESGGAALSLIDDLRPDLVLVDVRMPGMDGCDTTERIKAAHPSTVVVLISLEDSANVPASAADSGAAALVQKRDFGPALLKRLWTEHGTMSQRT